MYFIQILFKWLNNVNLALVNEIFLYTSTSILRSLANPRG